MTRIAVLSDIHGNLPALEAVVADAGTRGCSAFANLGDILSGPLWPAETADYLMQRDWPTIAGNHERQVLTDPDDRVGASDRHVREACSPAQLAWLAGLPVQMTVGGALCVHARPGNDHEYLLETVAERGTNPASYAEIIARLGGLSAPLLLHGHSHLQRDVRLAGGMRIANPGSVGLPAFADDLPFKHRIEAGSPDARYLILDGLAVELRTVPYDHESAARQAEAKGSPDWAQWLRTGKAH